MYYLLDADRRPYLVDDILEWARGFEKIDRCVALDVVGTLRVSTVFLGVSDCFRGGEPLVFETMIFLDNGWSECYVDRYATWAQAVAGHMKALAWASQQSEPADAPEGRH